MKSISGSKIYRYYFRFIDEDIVSSRVAAASRRFHARVAADRKRVTYANRSIIVAEKSSLAHAARLCTEQINWSTPTATYHSHLHKRAREPAFPASISLLLECPAVRPTPAISHHPRLDRPIEKTGPVQTGVSNVCGRDEMQTGAILFIVRRPYTYRALPVLGARAGPNAARNGSICLTTPRSSLVVINRMLFARSSSLRSFFFRARHKRAK